MCPNSNHSQFTFEKWGSPASQAIVERELAIQKRKPGNPDLFEVDQQDTREKPTTNEEPACKPGTVVQCEA